jgi:hypothetical protein
MESFSPIPPAANVPLSSRNRASTSQFLFGYRVVSMDEFMFDQLLAAVESMARTCR